MADLTASARADMSCTRRVAHRGLPVGQSSYLGSLDFLVGGGGLHSGKGEEGSGQRGQV